MKKRNRGFTLIELLVVIAIISLLSSVVLASLNSARAKARDAARLSELNQIRLAFEFFYDANGAYPGQWTTFYWIDDNNYSEPLPCSTMTGGLKPYISTVCSLKDPLGYHYAYTPANGNQSYILGARFELSQNQGAQFVYGPSNTVVSNYYQYKY